MNRRDMARLVLATMTAGITATIGHAPAQARTPRHTEMCEQRCSLNQSETTGSRCVYDCHADPVRSARQNAEDFAAALGQKGYDCSAVAGQVVCRKSATFGACGDKSWNTGRGC
ncbi:hypothetical protein [Nocardia blacklockiae]|uniref:hypothetical protein n=1 Tax=Nocardia blacklockiae TaxID=480036 RepID=UPI0018951D05|nr:hypothetical protein [Nocardia blacklockiae]MBF6175038.1 hypothetical protein [Nocardia blacklockiae]